MYFKNNLNKNKKKINQQPNIKKNKEKLLSHNINKNKYNNSKNTINNNNKNQRRLLIPPKIGRRLTRRPPPQLCKIRKPPNIRNLKPPSMIKKSQTQIKPTLRLEKSKLGTETSWLSHKLNTKNIINKNKREQQMALKCIQEEKNRKELKLNDLNNIKYRKRPIRVDIRNTTYARRRAYNNITGSCNSSGNNSSALSRRHQPALKRRNSTSNNFTYNTSIKKRKIKPEIIEIPWKPGDPYTGMDWRKINHNIVIPDIQIITQDDWPSTDDEHQNNEEIVHNSEYYKRHYRASIREQKFYEKLSEYRTHQYSNLEVINKPLGPWQFPLTEDERHCIVPDIILQSVKFNYESILRPWEQPLGLIHILTSGGLKKKTKTKAKKKQKY